MCRGPLLLRQLPVVAGLVLPALCQAYKAEEEGEELHDETMLSKGLNTGRVPGQLKAGQPVKDDNQCITNQYENLKCWAPASRSRGP